MYEKLKKDSTWTIIERSAFEIDQIKKEFLSYDEEWFLDTSRQERTYSHTNTQCYSILEWSYTWEPSQKPESIKKYSLKTSEAQAQLDKICKDLEDFYSVKVMRLEFIKLLPYRNINKHVDGGSSLGYARRCHIPIITNEKVLFNVKDNSMNMKEGICYEINNVLLHSVENPTSLDRVHLIIDILPDSMLQYNKTGE